ncbi:dihydrodipicolinate synthase/N-acetylneuraminate lyase [Granulicella aggregans]|uniref:Dihydrodipicolinate synthase/N-acetylneuraminate lyase n=1 Tax=Granulicella aggregans TaxID=474949 RepID=A0A7W7ZD25_9BACT|nr:dihydrodipicolinate synthase family protein [Granulicella aggregans]MBB5057645.1 dihydrodipicolinate synthase/N-acetylneuraminate lyase [Granulicella aggregans]
MLLEGLFLPLTTPFLPNGRLNLPKLRENVARYSKTPAAGLVALSHIGQPCLLSDAETEDTLRCVAEAAVAEKVLIAGVARDSVVHTLEMIEFAAKCGYDAAMVPLPSMLRGSDRGLEVKAYFEAVADSAALPVILDSRAGDSAIAADPAIDLARHRNILAITDVTASADWVKQMREGTAEVCHEVTVTSVFAAVTGRMIAKHKPASGTLVSAEALSGGTALAVAPAPFSTLKTRSKTVGFQILCGSTLGILDALAAGAAGGMPPLSASAPQACYEVFAAWKDGDPALAAEKQHRLQSAAEVVEEGLGVAGIKYGSDLNGYFGGRPRLPSLPLSSTERERVEVAMAGLRN